MASGWAAAIGRVGGILAPTVVGYMIIGNDGFNHVFMMFASVMFGVAVVVWLFGEETKGKSLQEISE